MGAIMVQGCGSVGSSAMLASGAVQWATRQSQGLPLDSQRRILVVRQSAPNGGGGESELSAQRTSRIHATARDGSGAGVLF